MKGTVISATGTPKPHDFQIQDENGVTYFAHLGDLHENENKLYDKTTETVFLQVGDKVDFEPVTLENPRAIHVRKT